jgi:putrescine transport system substrate-binding protein
MRPEVIAKASNFTSYANGNKASQQFVSKDVLEDPSVYPTDAVREKLYTLTPWDSKTQRVATRLWTKVTTGQ